MKDKLTSQEIFTLWKNEAKECGPNRFGSDQRYELLTLLVDLFYNYEIDKEEAVSYWKQVVDFMVTKLGKSQKLPKHKGWPKAVEEEYKELILKRYVDIDLNKIKEKTIIKMEEDTNLIPHDEKIEQWVQKKYKGSKAILKKAHNPQSMYFLEFLQDNFGEYLN